MSNVFQYFVSENHCRFLLARDCVQPKEREKRKKQITRGSRAVWMRNKYTVRNFVQQLSSHTKMPQHMPTQPAKGASCLFNLRPTMLYRDPRPGQRLHCDCILHMWQGVVVCPQFTVVALVSVLPCPSCLYHWPEIVRSFACCQEIHCRSWL